MNKRGTQEIDSLRKTRITFECLIGNQNTLNEPQPAVNPRSPIKKTKREPSTRPLKRIKFSSKPNYNFLDTQAQLLTPVSSTKALSCSNIGVLGTMFASFINSKAGNKVRCKIINVKPQYGSKLATVEVIDSKVPGIHGVMTMICNSDFKIANDAVLVEPKVIEIDKCFYIIPRDVLL
jgi:hypothetical protein